MIFVPAFWENNYIAQITMCSDNVANMLCQLYLHYYRLMNGKEVSRQLSKGI